MPLLLNATRNNAKLSGRRGIQFPWESRMALGEESSPRPGSGAWHEDHVTLDVALAFAQYGLPGLRLGAGQPLTWPTRPVVLPADGKRSKLSASGRSARLIARTGTSVPGWKRQPTSSGRTSTFLMVFQHTGDHVLILGSIGGRLHANRPAGARARPLRRHRARYSHTHWGTRPILSRRGPSLLGRCCLS